MKFWFYTLFASKWYQYNNDTTYRVSADLQQSFELLKYGVEWGLKGQMFLSQFCATKKARYKKCSVPLCRVQGKDCKDVQIVQARHSFRQV